jgi:hypothetical protein
MLVEHFRGQRLLNRLVAERGIRMMPGVKRWSLPRPGPPDPRFLQAAWIAHSLVSVTDRTPPVLVRVGPTEALPMSEIDWWTSDRSRGTNGWAGLNVALDGCRPEMGQILGLMEGRIGKSTGRAGFVLGVDRGVYVSRLCLVLRAHALAGMRDGCVQPVVESLRALELLGATNLGWRDESPCNPFRVEAENIRLAATLVREPDDAWLAAIEPKPSQFRVTWGREETERAHFEERVSQLRFLPDRELGRQVGWIWFGPILSALHQLPEPCHAWMILGFRGLAEGVCFPIWRFGWGDLAIVEYIRDQDRERDRERRAMESCSWREFEQGRDNERGEGEPATYRILCSGDTFEKRLSNEFRDQTAIGLNAVRIALLRHRLRQGGYPEHVGRLFPEFLHAIPVDWMSGKPLQYQLDDNGGFCLRAGGDDGKDLGWNGRSWHYHRSLDPTAGRRAWAQEYWDVTWPSRGTDRQKGELVEFLERQRAANLKASVTHHPYGMDLALMRRYGLLPRIPMTNAVSAGVGTVSSGTAVTIEGDRHVACPGK